MIRLVSTIEASLLGVAFSMDQSVDSDNGGIGQPTVTAAIAGTLTTRTDNDTGVVTATVAGSVATAGIVSTDKVDVYWEGGSRRWMTATVSTDAVTLDGGAGDNLPALNTAVTIKEPQQEVHTFVGATCTAIGVISPDYAATVVFRQADGTEILAVELDAGESYVWSSNSAVTNPVTGVTVGLITYSHASVDGSSVITAAYGRT